MANFTREVVPLILRVAVKHVSVWVRALPDVNKEIHSLDIIRSSPTNRLLTTTLPLYQLTNSTS